MDRLHENIQKYSAVKKEEENVLITCSKLETFNVSRKISFYFAMSCVSNLLGLFCDSFCSFLGNLSLVWKFLISKIALKNLVSHELFLKYSINVFPIISKGNHKLKLTAHGKLEAAVWAESNF